ncbi:MAG: serine O-acetyltransferase [Eubacteriales bacterium]|nr:serine O-acetyltransferase [Eubacteriales bacterium]
MGFFKDIREDVDAILEKDPAARTRLEVLKCYPGVWAIIWHKPAHWLYNHNHKFLARWLSQKVRHSTGIEIHPGAKIGKRCFIDHGMGVIIGETAEVGDDCTIYQGVTLGGTGKDVGKRHPTLGNNVMVSSGAKVLGPFKVGDNSKIGAGAVVIEEVPPNCTVVGVPGRIVKRNNVLLADMDQISMPDPVANELDCLRKRIEVLERMLQVQGAASENCEECASRSDGTCSGNITEPGKGPDIRGMIRKREENDRRRKDDADNEAI